MTPFSVSAQAVGGSSPIIGVNISVIDFDETYQYTGLSVSLDDNNDRWRCVSFNSSGACNAYGNADTNNSYLMNHYITGDIDFTNTVQSITRVYEYEFILDNSYVGSITFDKSFGATSTKVAFVNGSSFVVSSTTLTSSFTVSSYDLQRSDFDTWVYPIESFNIISYMLNNHPEMYVGLNSTSDYMFPIFNISPGTTIFQSNVADNDNWIQTFVFYMNGSGSINNVTNFNSNFTLSRGTCLTYKTINRFYFNGTLGYLCQVTIGNYGSDGPFTITYSGSINRDYMPIYCNSQVFNKNISTDFALVFGLSNQLLDDIHKIAEATPETEAAEENLDDQTDLASGAFSQFEGIESDFNDGFTDSLDQITITTPGAMGSKFQASAIWVKTQFDRITNSTPFGSILGFSLLLGLSLLIVGRVLR